MSRYRSYGKMDDRYVSEGDVAFLRMNNRLRPTQLQPGEVQYSQNGRMDKDGTWQPRQGLQTLAGSITLDQNAIRLPYQILLASRRNNIVTLTLDAVPNTAFIEGEDITVRGLTGGSILTEEGDHLRAENRDFLYREQAGIDDPNGTFTLDSISFVNQTLTYTEPGPDEDFSTSEISVVGPGSTLATVLDFYLNDTAAIEIHGSAVFSDPNAIDVDDFVFTATNNVCEILRLRDRTRFQVRYPVAETINSKVDMIQAFNKIFIFRGDETTLESTPKLTSENIAGASRTVQAMGSFVDLTVLNHGKSVGDLITVSGLRGWDVINPNGIQEITSVTTNTITYLSAGPAETFNISGAKVEYFNDFTKVQSGPYQVPSYIIDLNIESLDGQVTVDEVGHGLELGDELTIIKADEPLDLFKDQKVRVSEVPDDDTFKFGLDVENVSLGSVSLGTNTSLVLSKLRATSYFVHQPAAPFGVVNQRRLWLPYFFTSDTIPVRRENTDEIIASDILDSDTYDVIGNQFRITSGSSDFIVGLEPFTENTLIVFARRSIHRLSGVSGSLADVSVNVITPDLGCASRRSIVQVGNQVLFLSDQGVYALQFFDEYNLRGLEVPLSEPINPLIERINRRFIDKAVGAYFNNRYYLAVPLDGSNEANVILVYNFINQGWESIDTVDSLSFNVRDMMVAREETQNFLYITTSEGGIHKIEGYDGGDQVSVTAGVDTPETLDVESYVTTREYDADTIDRKYFNRSEIHLKSSRFSTSDCDITFNTSDPDRTRSGMNVRGLLGGEPLAADEDASLRTSVRLRGFGCSATIQPTQGRPFVRAVKVDARVTDRSTTSTT